MVTKEKLKSISAIIGLILIAVISIGAPLTFVFGNTSPTASYIDVNIQQINQLRYDYITAYGNYKTALGVILKYKIENLSPGVATEDMLDLLKILDK